MKIIRYQKMTGDNSGTANACEIRCPDDMLASNLALARAESCNGDVTVEDKEDDLLNIPLPLRAGITPAAGTANSYRRGADGLVVVNVAVTADIAGPVCVADLPEGYRLAAAVSSGDITVQPDGNVWAIGGMAGSVCFYALEKG